MPIKLRRKSTGSSSPTSSSASVSSEAEQIFKRRNSMTTRYKRYEQNHKLEVMEKDKTDDSDECYNHWKTKPYEKRVKVKKKSQNSIGSDDMFSSSDEVVNDFESDDDVSNSSPTTFEDMVIIFIIINF